MEKEHLNPRIATLNFIRKVNGTQCLIQYPSGIPSDDLLPSDDQRSCLQIFKICHTTNELTDAKLPGDPDTFLDVGTVLANKYMYVGSAKLEIDQRFDTTAFFQGPFNVLCSLSFLGKKSYCKTYELKDGIDTNCLARLFQQIIVVDPNTRKPTEIPSLWREKYGKSCIGSPFIMKKLTRPDMCETVSTYKIETSDLDRQGHMNWLVYVRLCLDLCFEDFDKNKFSKILSQNIENGLKEFQIRYENEAMQGEEVMMYAWETRGRGDQLCFEISKGQDVCIQATMTFYQTSMNIPKLDLISSKI